MAWGWRCECQVLPDGLLELPGRAMRAAADAFLAQRGKPRSTWLSLDAEVGVGYSAQEIDTFVNEGVLYAEKSVSCL
jgi:hypothetical protein